MLLKKKFCDNMYQEALAKIQSNDPNIKSGLYYHVVPIIRDGKTFALRIKREKPNQPLTMYLDTQEVVSLNNIKIELINKLRTNDPTNDPGYTLPGLYYVNNKYEVWDYVGGTKQLWEISNYPSLEDFPTLDQALDDYYRRWPEIPIDRFNTPHQWSGSHPRDFLKNNCIYARELYKERLKNYAPIFELLEFPNWEDPFKIILKQASSLTERAPLYTEADRNGRNILFKTESGLIIPSKPIFVDIDSCRKGDFVAALVTNEHRLGQPISEIYSSIQRRLERISPDIDPKYINGWKSDIELFHLFELMRNSITLILTECKNYQENNNRSEVTKYCADIYNQLRKILGLDSIEPNIMHQKFLQFTRERKRSQPTLPKASPHDNFTGLILPERDTRGLG